MRVSQLFATTTHSAIEFARNVSIAWLVLIAIGYVLAWLKWPGIPYSLYQKALPFAGAALFLVAVWSVYCVAGAASTPNAKLLNSHWVLAIAIFWAIFPPLWFLMEQYWYASNFIHGIPEFDDATKKKVFMDSVGKFQDLAAKVWAGFGALLAAVISQFGK